MEVITKTKEIVGGNGGAAVAIGLAVFNGAALLGQSVDYFNDLGHRIGENWYNLNHPNSGLGPMIYYR